MDILGWYIVLSLQCAGGDPDVGDEGVAGVLAGVEGEADLCGSLGGHSGERGDTWHLGRIGRGTTRMELI